MSGVSFFAKNLLSLASSSYLLWISGGLSAAIAQPASPPPELFPMPPETTPAEPESLPTVVPRQTFSPDALPPRSPRPPVFDFNDSSQFSQYRLSIGDGVSVTLPNFPEFNFAAAIDPEGNVEVPILGRISVRGLTLDELENKIAAELGRRYLLEVPEVNAQLSSLRPVDLTVIGEVVRPGYYNLAQGTPLDILIAQAGGATHQADLRSVVIRRPLVDGTVQEERVDLYTPLMQGQSPPLFRLQGGDTVIVSPLDTGRTQDYDREFVARTALAKPTITVRVLAPQGGGQGIGGVGTAIRNLELPNGSTFLDVVNQFPAYSPLLVREQVTLLRFDPEQGKVVRQELNPINTARELDFSQYVSLRDQDVIVVSRTLLGKFLAFFNILTQPIRDVFGFVNTIDRFDNFNRNRR